MVEVIRIRTEEDWRAVLGRPGPSLLFKHSTACPISRGAYQEFLRWVAGLEDDSVQPYLVNVLEERPLSRTIAANVGVDHQSPQALLSQNGRVIWHASHYAVTEAAIREAVAHPHTTESHSTSLVRARAEHRAKAGVTG